MLINFLVSNAFYPFFLAASPIRPSRQHFFFLVWPVIGGFHSTVAGPDLSSFSLFS
ncbi:unnamed protein product [Arabidopsis halleri]